MKVLVVGGGAREHAICHKLRESSRVEKLWCAPGNAGIAQDAECIDIKAEDVQKIRKFAASNGVDMVVVGPEVPLVEGLSDELKAAGIKVFGPEKAGAKLEGSKAYSKDFMKKYSIPTARYEVYTESDLALEGLKLFDMPVVVKADGLAAGKGVIICETESEAENAVRSIMCDHQFGKAGSSVVVEEFLDGIEASLLCFVNGNDIIPMESARDYKKAYDGDKGLNTGGMGNFSPNPIYTEELSSYIKANILDRTMAGLKGEGIDFRGVLFIGLMVKGGKAKVLEYNVRFGDPETEVVLPRLSSDLCDIMEKTIDGTLKAEDLIWKPDKSVTVILASGGYPESYEKGKEITGLSNVDDDIMVYHAGTKLDKGKIVTSGGRVLAVTALGATIKEARAKVYQNIQKIHFDGMEYRTDIALI